MKLIKGEALLNFVSNTISDKKQLYQDCINLTVKSIYEIKTKGKVDFGGSEFNLGDRREIKPVKINADDKYGWWDLEQSDYIILFNEKVNIKEGFIGFLQPLERLIVNGATHENVFIPSRIDKVEVNLRVGKAGIKIKENARISNLIIFKTD